MSEKKKRLDIKLVETGTAQSRERAKSLIMAGRVIVNGKICDKSGMLVSGDDTIALKGKDIPFVSRGGIKLESALTSFNIDISGSVCLDVGASTGGFTDCLLRHGAKQVIAVDVGYGQMAWNLRKDPRILVIERTNIRYLPCEAVPEPVDFVTIDVSFISLKIVVPAVLKFMKTDGSIIALIKPQFEVGKGKVGKGGIVRDASMHNEVIENLSAFFAENGLKIEGVIPSPVTGPKGNREFLIYMKIKQMLYKDQGFSA
jgi:23S rRNA (cytidine1920-2'-O)/16S rRNA (cytidine1409-2'-O)-methyltransferase